MSAVAITNLVCAVTITISVRVVICVVLVCIIVSVVSHDVHTILVCAQACRPCGAKTACIIVRG